MGRKGSGVEVRPYSIRLAFVLNGEEIRERLTLNGASLKPTPANIKHAHRMAAQIRKDIEAGVFNYAEYFPDSPRAKSDGSGPATFGELADLWLDSQGKLTPATRNQYGTAVRFWKKLLGEKRLLKDITYILLTSKIGGYPWPSAKTHNNYLIALRGILGLVYRGPESAKSPLIGIANMKVIKKLPDPLTTADRDLLLADIKAHYDARIYAYFVWQFYTGMRPEETIALRWSDVDWSRQTVRVQRVRTFKGSERDGSKTHSEREVDLLPQAVEALHLMKPHTFLLKVERERDPDSAAEIFQNPVTGKAWHDERSQRDHYWKPAMKRTGIRWRTPYHTRHTFATAALMTGTRAGYIAAQLGHSEKMLHDKYARWMPENDRGNARAMLAAGMAVAADSSHEPPTTAEGGDNPLISLPNFGRRDWTRTK